MADNRAAFVGVAHHNGWAILVTVAGDGSFLDRRRVELVDAGLPCMPHHGEGQRVPLAQALDLVERVRVSAHRQARLALDALAHSLRPAVRGIAIHVCPRLPASTAEQIRNYWAQARADSVMYREALAAAAEARGWTVHWYDARKVLPAARDALGVADIDAHLHQIGASLGPPWRKDHRIAMAAAIVAGRARS